MYASVSDESLLHMFCRPMTAYIGFSESFTHKRQAFFSPTTPENFTSHSNRGMTVSIVVLSIALLLRFASVDSKQNDDEVRDTLMENLDILIRVQNLLQTGE